MSNKGGLHCQDGNKSNLVKYLQACANAGHPVGLIKVLADIGPAMDAKRISPSTFTIWRKPVHYSGPDDQDNPDIYCDLTRPQIEAMAARWMTIGYVTWRSPVDYLHPEGPKVCQFIDAFEITNEGNPQNERDIKNFDAFFIACMKHAEAQPEKFKLALWSFSSGCPEPEHVEWMRPSLEYARGHGHLLAVHDGGVDDEKPHFQDNWNGVPEEGCALRYRMFKRILGFSVPVVITEAYQVEGYRKPDWTDWQWYLIELRKDPEVIGCGWFTDGNYNFGGESVNVDNVIYNDNPQVPTFATTCITAAQALIDEGSFYLAVPFLPQNGQFSGASSADCGAACLAMQLVYNGIETTVDEVFSRTGKPPNTYLTFNDLEACANTYGKTLKPYLYGQSLDQLRAMLDNKKPPILLVNATYLNKAYAFNGAHFVLGVGRMADGTLVTHDPNSFPCVAQPGFANAWGKCHDQGNPDNTMLVLSDGLPEPPPPPPPSATLSGVGLAEARPLTQKEIEAVTLSKVKAVKVLTVQHPPDGAALLDQMRAIHPGLLIMARLMCPFNPDAPVTPQMFVDYCGGPALAMYVKGVELFEIHNEVNIAQEGWGTSWADGVEFAEWYSDVLYILRRTMPNAMFGFPGLSPQEHDHPGICEASDKFLDEARQSVLTSDFLCCHNYYQSRGTCHWQMESEDFGGWYYRRAQRKFPSKPLYITEYSCNNPNVSDTEKGRMYRDYVANLPGVVAAFSFCLSWQNDVAHEGWVRSGEITDIPRQF